MLDAEHFRRIDEIFQAALLLDPAQRPAYISEACGGDESQIKEVEYLLSSDEEQWDLIGMPAFGMVAPLLARENQPELSAGELIAQYRIVSLLGVGGMGQVYLAEDTKLGRNVALKLLPANYTQDESRLRRFQQEARAASALNHPNILTIFDVLKIEKRHFIVTEYIEGESLGQRLNRAELNADESLDIAIQIATALAAAHQAGIIHRDIKPENIMLRHEGYVKVLDFGLAKLTEQQQPTTQIPPFDDVNISSGLLMGTVKYMSPEQARGEQVDSRSDIFSLGVVLYEMIAGRAPFEGKTSGELIAAILKEEAVLPANSHIEIQSLIDKTLRKNKDERYQTVQDLLADLKSLKEDNSTSSTSAHEVLKRHKTGVAFSIMALLALGVLATFGLNRYFRRSVTSPSQLKITRVPNTTRSVAVAISPDDKYFAHAITAGGKQSLWIMDRAGGESHELVSPADAEYTGLTFSKDGSHIFYVNYGTLYRISLSGGSPQKLLDGATSGISFSPDGGRFAFVSRRNDEESALMIANADGSGEQTLITRKKPDSLYSGPAWSPDGNLIVCALEAGAVSGGTSVLAVEFNTGREKSLTGQKWQSMDRLAWLPDGSGLIAAAIETGAIPIQIWFIGFPNGEVRKITNDLNDYGDLYLSADGKSLATIQFANRSRIWLIPRGDTGQARPVTTGEHEQYRALALTPDGRILYAANTDKNRDIWIMNADETGTKQLTVNAGNNLQPDASPDGRYIVFPSNRTGKGAYNIWRMNIDGSNPIQLTYGSGEVQPDCSPDGRWVVYSKGGPDTNNESKTLWKVPIDGGEPIQLIETPSGGAAISPDGALIATWYKQGRDSSSWQIALASIEGGPLLGVFDAQRSTPFRVRWTPDGQAITYVSTRDGIGNIWSQPTSGEPAKQLTNFTSEQMAGFDWSPTGDLVCVRNHTTRDIVVMTNFR